MKNKKKSTGIEVEKRLIEIERQLLEGKSRLEILQFTAENWKIETRQTDDYIKKVKEKWEAEFNKQFQENLAEAIVIRKYLFQKAMEKKNYREALNIDIDLRKLQGLYERVETETETSKKVDELIKEIREIFSSNEAENK